MKLLVVDDEKIILRLVKNIAIMNDIEASCAYDGKEALDVLKKEGLPDMILTDYNMPQMNGLDLIRSVRETYPYASYYSALMTGRTLTESMVNESKALGIDTLIKKPFSVKTIEDIFNSCSYQIKK